MPRSLRILTISWSESGLFVLSRAIRSWIASFTLVFDITSPERGLVTGREKIFQVEQAVGRLHVLVGDGAADRRLVHADDFGDLVHGQRLEMRHALVEKGALPLHDLGRDVEDGRLPLVQALDQEFAGADFFLQVLAQARRRGRC